MADIIEYAKDAPGGGGTATKAWNVLFVGAILYFLFAGSGSSGGDDLQGVASRRRRRRRRSNRRR